MNVRWLPELFDRSIRGRPVPGVSAWLKRPFSRKSSHRLLILYTSSAICRAQVAPFIQYGAEIEAAYQGEVRLVELERIEKVSSPLWRDATHIVIQPWFTIAPDDLSELCGKIKTRAPDAALSFMDGFAPNDLRLARHLPEDLAFYLKKSLFADLGQYDRVWHGDTNLVEYYSDLYGLGADPVDFTPPPNFTDKLRLSPNFFTAPRLTRGFAAPAPPAQSGRKFDIQTRLGRKGSPWYTLMRDTALAAVEGQSKLVTSPAGRVSYPDYVKEMTQSRLCFSPFGYGELCWRDIEAFMTGAVLVKPDMSHLVTLPDLYEPWVTYVPISWDFSDAGQIMEDVLADEEMRVRISNEAYRRVKDYIDSAHFVKDVAFLFK